MRWTDQDFQTPNRDQAGILTKILLLNVPDFSSLTTAQAAAVVLDFFNTLNAAQSSNPAEHQAVLTAYLNDVGRGNFRSYATCLLSPRNWRDPVVRSNFMRCAAGEN
jgi:hypothetical protein